MGAVDGFPGVAGLLGDELLSTDVEPPMVPPEDCLSDIALPFVC